MHKVRMTKPSRSYKRKRRQMSICCESSDSDSDMEYNQIISRSTITTTRPKATYKQYKNDRVGPKHNKNNNNNTDTDPATPHRHNFNWNHHHIDTTHQHNNTELIPIVMSNDIAIAINEMDIAGPSDTEPSATEALLEVAPHKSSSAHFEQYHAELMERGVLWRDDKKTTLILPQQHKHTHKCVDGNFHHTRFVNDKWICDKSCDDFTYRNQLSHCDHTLIAQLVANGNPTQIPINTVQPHQHYRSTKHEQFDAVHLFVSDKGRRSTVFSVQCDLVPTYGFVYETLDEINFVCSRHKGDKSSQ